MHLLWCTILFSYKKKKTRKHIVRCGEKITRCRFVKPSTADAAGKFYRSNILRHLLKNSWNRNEQLFEGVTSERPETFRFCHALRLEDNFPAASVRDFIPERFVFYTVIFLVKNRFSLFRTIIVFCNFFPRSFDVRLFFRQTHYVFFLYPTTVINTGF